jgi:sugar lactone lactonase YvrE
MLAGGVALAALILLGCAAAYLAHAFLGGARDAGRVVGMPVAHWAENVEHVTLLSDPVALTSDAGGELYVLDGQSDQIHAFAADGTPLFTWGGRGAGRGKFQAPSSLAVDGSGTIYVADTGNNRVQVFSSSGQWRASWTGQGATQLSAPGGIAVGPRGRIYVSDTQNDRILVYSRTGRLVNARIIQTQPFPTSLATDKRGVLYVLTTLGIEVVSSRGAVMSQWPRADVDDLAVDGHGDVWGVGGGAITHLSAQGELLSRFHLAGTNDPEGISFDGRGFMYLADTGARQVERALPGRVTARFGRTSGISVRPSPPGAVATDRTGNVYVAAVRGRVRVYSPAGQLIHVWVVPEASSAAVPRAITVDTHGDVFVVDGAASHVWKVAPDGRVLSRWGQDGDRPGQFTVPAGVAVDSRDHVYIADAGNARIQEFSGTGHFLQAFDLISYAGSSGLDPHPFGLAIDARNDLYVADAFLDTILKFSPAGRLLARLGSRGSWPGRLPDLRGGHWQQPGSGLLAIGCR